MESAHRARLLLLVLLSAGASVAAQDPVALDPKIVKVEFENSDVRVLRAHLEPGESLATHSHPPRLSIFLRDAVARTTFPDKTSAEVHATAGKVIWRKAETHSVQNIGDTVLENIELEFKKAAAPAIRVTQPPTSAGSAATKEPVPVHWEPHHHLVLENQYVRVLDVVLAPGESTAFHTHSNDNFAVRLGEALGQRQNMGEEWAPPSQVKNGEVSFTDGAKKPYTHRVKNVGKTTFHVIDVEILR